MPPQKVHIHKILKILELPPDSWKLMNAKSFEEAKMILVNFKALVKKQHRILVKKYHPDLPANGEKEEDKIKQINAMIDVVKGIKLHQAPPQPQMIKIRVFRTNTFTGTSNSTTATNFYNF